MNTSNWYKHCVWLVQHDQECRNEYIKCLINPKYTATLEVIHPVRLLIDGGIRVDVSLYVRNYRELTKHLRGLS